MDAYAFQAKLTRIAPLGLTVRGLRFDVSFAGSLTEGRLTGCTLEGIDYLLIRPDGVGVLDVRWLASDAGRVIAAVRVEGYIVPPFAMPELSVLANPDFQWPDVDLPLHGAAFWETSDEDLSTADSTVYGFTGSVNVATGVLEVSAHSLAALNRPAGVG